ncbi:MAG: hypothetical protein OEW59_10855 [Gammaproteobacteria bacterium]|nr:hypothetical protein [Gammaproteobacteria bacterium]
MKRGAILLLYALSAVPAGAGDSTLDQWLERDLVPYVRQQLSTLPRFRNESFRFVIMQDDRPESEGTQLAMHIRDRIRDAASEVAGIRVAWQGDQPGVGLAAGTAALDCAANDANYFVGIELEEVRPGQANIRVRALDVEERTWVAGFGRSWHGEVEGPQRQALTRIVSDPTFRGERNAPWKESETDLMAAGLAYELGCKLFGQTAGEYVVTAGDGNAGAIVELVGNNLAGFHALRIGGDANAVIEGKAHRIDEDLYQYWVTITPTDPDDEMISLSADAYVRIPDPYRAATLVPEATLDLARSDAAFLTDFGLVRLYDARACAADRPYYAGAADGRSRARDCFALRTGSSDDAVVFFLNHQLNYGLVRLADGDCESQANARVVRADEALEQALPVDTLRSGSWSDATDWVVSPAADTYYVLAASDTKAARALSRHVAKLPRRCAASVRPGLEGEALRRWLDELAVLATHWSPAIDWRSIKVKDVY